MEERVLSEIIKYYKTNKLMPSIRFLQNKLNVQSTNTIYYYLNKLEKDGYLVRNTFNQRIINDNYEEFNNGLKYLKVINSNEIVKLILNKNKDYLAYKAKNNYLLNEHIMKNDILIIEKRNKLKNNDLGLFIINKEYTIKKYYYQDGFYILKDQSEIILNNPIIIGKVILIERKI